METGEVVKVRLIFTITLLAFLSATKAAETTLNGVETIVYVGPKHVDNGLAGSYDIEEFYHEAGQLDCKDGFIPVTHSLFSVTVANNGVPNAAGVQQASSYKAVNGFFIDTLANYTIGAKHLDLKCFHRSSSTYSFAGTSYVQAYVPYVAITTKSSPPSYASVSPIEPTISEGGPTGEFLIALDKPSWRTVTVRYRLSGTAKNGKDYRRLSGKVKILAGNISTTVKIVPRRDRLLESAEDITINIKTSKKYYLSGSNSATIAITD